jgi:prepilin-type N-terminal cleavage/methylation domain
MKKKNEIIRALRKNGFTLLELILVISILAVTAMAIYAVFNSGIKIWRVAGRQIPEEELGIFFEKFTSDLRNAFRSESIIFIGKKDEIRFAALVDSPRLQARSAGKVIYSYDYQAGAVEREAFDASHIYEVEGGRVQRSIGNIRNFNLLYYFYDDKTKEYAWKEEWLEDEKFLPLAVRVELLLDKGGEMENFVKTINIPAGGGEDKDNA